jgi:hypothetical protein
MNGPQMVVDMLCGDLKLPHLALLPKRELTFMRRLEEVVVPTSEMIETL